MGVKVKERRRGEWWIFINHNGRLKTKKIGKDQARARQVPLDAQGRKDFKTYLCHYRRRLRGHNVDDVSYQLGHSSIQITYDIYDHWIPSLFKGEVDDLDCVPGHKPGATDTQPRRNQSKK